VLSHWEHRRLAEMEERLRCEDPHWARSFAELMPGLSHRPVQPPWTRWQATTLVVACLVLLLGGLLLGAATAVALFLILALSAWGIRVGSRSRDRDGPRAL
jgi:hypothetical protein